MEVHLYLQKLTLQRMISLCWMSTTFYHCHLHLRRCPLKCPSLFAKYRGQPSSRWPRPFPGKSLWIWLPMLGWIYCLHRLLLPPHRQNIALICCERQKSTNSTSGATEFVTKTLAPRTTAGAKATAFLYFGATAATAGATVTTIFSTGDTTNNVGAAANTPTHTKLFLGWRGCHWTIRLINTRNGSP